MRNEPDDPKSGDVVKSELYSSPHSIREHLPGSVFPARQLLENRPKLSSIPSGESILRPGDRVRLYPQGPMDAFDLAVTEKLATIMSIEQDEQDRIYLAVTLADESRNGKTPSNRYYFRPDEV